MRSFLIIFLIAGFGQRYVTANQVTDEEMIRAAEFIAIIDLRNVTPRVHRPEPLPEHTVRNWFGHVDQTADAMVETALKGDLPKMLTLKNSIVMFDLGEGSDCVLLEPGKCLVFLARHGETYSLLNDHSLWEIKDGQVKRLGKLMPLADVIQEITRYTK